MIDLGGAMAGENCRAEPFAEHHRDALRAACAEDREIWAIYANDFGPAGFDASIDFYVQNPRNRTFVLFDRDELAGMSSFIGLDEGRQTVEIGGTFFRPQLRGTGVNRRVKDMMLRRAFERGIRRVEFRVDARNQHSQTAMAKLGAVREGVLRADRITWTGHVRDTVLFSMLAEEWDDVAASRRMAWLIDNHPERFDYGDIPPDRILHPEQESRLDASRPQWAKDLSGERD